MQVIAKQVGIYGPGKTLSRRYPKGYPDPVNPHPNAGQPFDLVKMEDFSGKWMEFVTGTPEEKAYAEKKTAEASGKKKAKKGA